MTASGRFKAAILVKSGEELVIDDVVLPAALGPGQVLVRIHYSGICGSQIGEIDAVKGNDKWLPHLLGHEASGVVLDTGPGVRHVAESDTVVLHWRPGLGIASEPPKYKWGARTVNAGLITTFSEMAVISENRMTKVPPTTDFRIAPLLGCAVTTGFGVVVNDAEVAIGESVVVFGAGGVGLNIVQAAAMVSADPVIAVDRYDNRLELAHDLGATHTINADSVADVRAEVETILDGQPLDVFIDNTGNTAVIELGYGLSSPVGRVVLVGVPRAGEDVTLHTLPLHFGKRIIGSEGGGTLPQRDISRYLRLYEKGKLELGALLQENAYPLDRINEAILAMRDGSAAGRCLIDMQ